MHIKLPSSGSGASSAQPKKSPEEVPAESPAGQGVVAPAPHSRLEKLLAYWRQEPGWARVQALFEAGDSEILAASVSLAEFARRLRDLGATVEEARHAAEDYMEAMDELVPVDESVALAAFDIGCGGYLRQCDRADRPRD